MKRSMITLAAAAASALVLAACGSAQTVDGGTTASSTGKNARTMEGDSGDD